MSWPVVLDPIGLYRGDSRVMTFRFWNDDAKTVPTDLTGFGTEFTGNLRKSPDAELLEALAIDASQAATGQLTITITPDAWTALAGVLALGWDVQAASADGASVTTLLAGRFAVTPDYTHA